MDDLITTDFAAKFAAEIAGQTYSKIIKNIAQSVSLTPVSLQINLAEYATLMYDNLSQIRTIVSDSPSRLLDIYQDARFRLSSETYLEAEFIAFLGVNHQAVIRGNAGAGKSMFLRRHFLRVIGERKRIPILFDLRSLNSNYSSVIEHLHGHAKGLMPWMDYGVFCALLKNGRIELLLDGLDEVSHNIRPAVNTAIATFVTQYPKANVILTTRYGDRYAVPSRIPEFHVCQFSKEQAVSLIRSLDFAEEAKLRFAKALSEGLYDKSPDLLSNPLLCSIMLLTYKRFAKVPEQLHLYYQQAYEVLYSRHDAEKDGFNREFLSKLDIAEMQSVLDYFSAVTYAADAFEFSEVECIDTLRSAIDVAQVSARPEDVKDDLIEAMSLINRDGVELAFVHRSFQEFFCAHYISKTSSELARSCIDAVKMRDDTDSVIPMAVALNPERFEEAWFLPSLREDSARYRDYFNKGKYFDIIRDTLPIVHFEGDIVRLALGTQPHSKSFGVYLRRMNDEGAFIELDMSKKGKSFSLGDHPSVASYVRSAAFHLPVPKQFREQQVPGKLSLDAEDRVLSVLGEIDIWKTCALEIVNRLEKWLRLLEERKAKREVSPLDRFKRAAAASARRVEGDLQGGKQKTPLTS